MGFIILMTVFSVVFIIIATVELIESVKDGTTHLGPYITPAVIVGGCFCLCLVITYPIAVSELQRVKQELKELKEKNKIESVYEPVNEVLYRKCK